MLRSSLLAVCLLGGLGATGRAEPPQKVYLDIHELGCWVSAYAEKEEGKYVERTLITLPESATDDVFRRLVPLLRQLREPFKLICAGSPLTVRSFRLFPQIGEVRHLALTEMVVGDKELGHIVGMRSLRSLYISGSGLTPDGYQQFAKLTKLESIIIPDLSPSMVRHLRGFPALTTIQTQDSSIDDRLLRELDEQGLLHKFGKCTDQHDNPAKNADAVHSVDLSRLNFSDDMVSTLSSFSNLRVLNLCGTKLTDKGVARLKCLTSVRVLDLSETALGDRALEALAELPELTELDIGETKIGDKGAKHLRRMKGLRRLELSGTNIGMAGLREVGHLRELRSLGLEGIPITVEGLTSLSRLPHLERLEIEAGFVDDEIVWALDSLGMLHRWRGSLDARLKSPSDRATIAEVNLRETKVTAKALQNLVELPGLKSLLLEQSQITDDVIRVLHGAGKLHVLFQSRKDDGEPRVVSYKRRPASQVSTCADEIEFLDLSETKVTDSSAKFISSLSGLEVLLLPSGVTAKGVSRLRGLPSLDVLTMEHTVDDRMLKALVSSGLLHAWVGASRLEGPHKRTNETIESLGFDSRDDRAKITDAGLQALPKLPNLTGLYLGEQEITDVGMKTIGTFARLTSLQLRGTEVTDSGLAHLDRLTKLESLDLSGTRVTDKGLARLGRLEHLRELHLDRTKVTDACLDILVGLLRLETLSLNRTRITRSGLLALARSRSLRAVTVPKLDDSTLRLFCEAKMLHLLAEAKASNVERAKETAGVRCLDLGTSDVTPKGLTYLKVVPELRELELPEGVLTLESVEHVIRLEKLVSITFHGMDTPAPVIAKLQERLPGCTLLQWPYGTPHLGSP